MDSQAHSAIRHAVSSGEFAKALDLWTAYAGQVSAEIDAGTCSEERLAQIRELLEWTRGVVICAHAHARHALNTRLTELHAAAAYGSRFR